MDIFRDTIEGRERARNFDDADCLNQEMYVPDRKPDDECAGLLFSMSAIVHDGARSKCNDRQLIAEEAIRISDTQTCRKVISNRTPPMLTELYFTLPPSCFSPPGFTSISVLDDRTIDCLLGVFPDIRSRRQHFSLTKEVNGCVFSFISLEYVEFIKEKV